MCAENRKRARNLDKTNYNTRIGHITTSYSVECCKLNKAIIDGKPPLAMTQWCYFDLMANFDGILCPILKR